MSGLSVAATKQQVHVYKCYCLPVDIVCCCNIASVVLSLQYCNTYEIGETFKTNKKMNTKL